MSDHEAEARKAADTILAQGICDDLTESVLARGAYDDEMARWVPILLAFAERVRDQGAQLLTETIREVQDVSDERDAAESEAAALRDQLSEAQQRVDRLFFALVSEHAHPCRDVNGPCDFKELVKDTGEYLCSFSAPRSSETK